MIPSDSHQLARETEAVMYQACFAAVRSLLEGGEALGPIVLPE
jgi:hypothetical protein